jgi:hypothetical protein
MRLNAETTDDYEIGAAHCGQTICRMVLTRQQAVKDV